MTAPLETPAPRKRRWGRGCLFAFLGGVGLIIVIIIITALAGGGGGGGSTSGSPSAANPSSAPSSASVAGIGSKVRDGKFEFVVTGITHAKTVGPSGFGQTAQGRYTILHVSVTNIGSEAQTLDDSNQFVFDAAGRKFSADSQADLYINGSSNSVFLQDINPGNTVHGKIAFDLPSSDKAVKAELHDSAFSDGVTVSLTG
jgi:uncharacterized protein DUF4352